MAEGPKYLAGEGADRTPTEAELEAWRRQVQAESARVRPPSKAASIVVLLSQRAEKEK